jgi:hypothetical protein
MERAQIEAAVLDMVKKAKAAARSIGALPLRSKIVFSLMSPRRWSPSRH